MGRIGSVFSQLKQEGKKGFIPFITAGDPDLQTTEDLLVELSRAGATVVAAASIINRGGGDEMNVPYVSLAEARFPTYAPDALPDTLRDVPVVKPGSRPGQT